MNDRCGATVGIMCIAIGALAISCTTASTRSDARRCVPICADVPQLPRTLFVGGAPKSEDGGNTHT